MMNVNCDGVFFCCKAQITHFMETGTKGAIVNVSSTAAERVFPLCSAYGRLRHDNQMFRVDFIVTAKHAVQGITRCAAVEYSHHGIR
jgi:NAD(P)-dependent dehydrogenase (short-subunit alcohol dehydrogenase family)